MFSLASPSAVVWGASAKHSRGQKVGLDHILEDEDGMYYLLRFSLATFLIPLLMRSGTHLQEVRQLVLMNINLSWTALLHCHCH